MITTLFVLLSIFSIENNTYKIDFGLDKQGTDWYVINDGVMGGLSRGKASLTENSILFKGTVSLENNGGFSSLKAPFESIDLSAYEKLRIKYRSKDYKVSFTLEIHEMFYLPYFKEALQPGDNEWQTVDFNLDEFYAYRLGRKTGSKLTKEDLQNILRLGFISDEKRAGNFEIEIDYLEFL